MHHNKKLSIFTTINTNGNFEVMKEELPLNTWHQIDITSELYDGTALYQINLNGNEIFYYLNSNPLQFTDVKVYMGDPRFPPVDGNIRYLSVENIDTCESGWTYFGDSNMCCDDEQVAVCKPIIVHDVPLTLTTGPGA